MITAKIQTTSGKVLEATRNLQDIYDDVNAWNVLVVIWNYIIPSTSIVSITIVNSTMWEEEDLWEKIYKKIDEKNEKNEEKNEENE